MSEIKKTLTPFEAARANISKTAENFNIYDSVVLMVDSLVGMEELSKEDREDMQNLFNSLIVKMALFIEGSGAKWN